MAKIILDPGHVEGDNRGAVSGYVRGGHVAKHNALIC